MVVQVRPHFAAEGADVVLVQREFGWRHPLLRLKVIWVRWGLVRGGDDVGSLGSRRCQQRGQCGPSSYQNATNAALRAMAGSGVGGGGKRHKCLTLVSVRGSGTSSYVAAVRRKLLRYCCRPCWLTAAWDWGLTAWQMGGTCVVVQ